MWLKLDGQGSLQRQLCAALRAAILDGRFAPGARIPSSRELAQDLEVSRNTVIGALDQLISEGYLIGRRGSGTYVTRALPVAHPQPVLAVATRTGNKARRLSRLARAAARFGRLPSWELRRDPRTIDFRYGDPAYQDLPLATWARLYARMVRRARARDLAYSAPGGHPRLREAIAAYLARARAVRCDARQVIVTSGSQQAFDLCARVLVDPGDRVGLEEPHYPVFRLALLQARAAIVPIPVDADGLQVERLRKQRDLKLICVTPSHQFPTGALLPASRRLALLDWARRHDSYVIEDDYDGEFRYAGRPLESLQGTDTHERVLYIGTFSKSLFPALRMGYVVVPEALVDPFLYVKAATDTGSSLVEQHVLAEFISAGHFERHVRRTRVHNAARHAALLSAITRHLGARVRFGRQPAGLHVWLELPALAANSTSSLVALARARGVTLHSGAACHSRQPACASFIVGYTSLSESQIERGMQRLGLALDELLSPIRS